MILTYSTYFCSLILIHAGQMLECTAGRYKGPVNPDLSLVSLESTAECADCPHGRYRTITRGRSADDCVKCPIGKYANITGSVSVIDCQRCPAGMTAEEPGTARHTYSRIQYIDSLIHPLRYASM